MRFLVQIEVKLPPTMSTAERQSLLERERVRGHELKENGSIHDIWRIPGRLANVGIWEAASVTSLHEALVSLPVWPWTEIVVTPLADHYLTTSPEALR